MKLKNLIPTVKDHWEVRKTIWPYKEGYGVYNARKRIVLETGLTREEATKICKEMNG